jgi:PEP-CTERM motif
MPRNNPLFPLSALGVVLLAASAAPAAPVSWTYNWSTDTSTISADVGGVGTVSLVPAPAGTLSGPGTIPALSFTTLTTATDTSPDHFTGKTYTLTLDLTDNDQDLSGSLHFLGTLNGTLSAANDGTTLGFNHLTGSLDLGADQFNVTLAPPPAAGLGNISAQVNIQEATGGGTGAPPPGPPPSPGPRPGPEPGPQDSPEPSALVLAALGLAGVGVQAWRRRGSTAAGQPAGTP